MKKLRKFALLLGIAALACTTQSCLDDDDDSSALMRPTALVTVRPTADGSFTMQLDDKTTLVPTNVKESPYKDKIVRALVNYTAGESVGDVCNVHVNWIDSIRTKNPVPSLGDLNDEKYGKDAVDIVNDWVTVAEDGFLTLRVRTVWGGAGRVHYMNLLSGVNPENPYEFELRHDAKGDTYGTIGDALIAFNLNDLPHDGDEPVKIKLNWNSFNGSRSTEFDLTFSQKNAIINPTGGVPSGKKFE